MVRAAIPRGRILEISPLTEGLRNSNFKVGLESAPHWIVLRIYEHDASLCQKELDLMRLVNPSVPVPEVIHAEPQGLDDFPPFMVRLYVEGITFMELRRGDDNEAIAQAAYSAGQTLAAIGRFNFPKPGWLAPGPSVGAPLLEGDDPAPRFVDLCLASANLQRRLRADLRDRIHALVWSYAPRLKSLAAESSLVHGDYNKRNVLLRETAGRWSVAAVLDWEFAVSGSPLADIANFVRYDRAARSRAEPHFSTGYTRAGGELPEDWRRLAKVLDLTALCESLTRDGLPDSVVMELVELLRATVENRDPQFN
ncbi:MAG TPA: phosphotransferase [Bryobacteraceae bacterium]|nr:phosphotransferase [Bryobacteraceae bacterium]